MSCQCFIHKKKLPGKPAATDHTTEQLRLAIFVKNLESINAHNERYQRGEVSHKLAINHFADMTADELRQLNGFKRKQRKVPQTSFKFGGHTAKLATGNDSLPKKVDWRAHNYVTPVKNQGNCGSCWAFSATGALEGQHKRKTGKLVSLSEQNLVDCGDDYGSNGCDGGLMDDAFMYVVENGIDTEATYPYEASNQKCRFNKRTVGSNATDWTDLPSGDELALQEAVAHSGPISVALDVLEDFVFYSEGIYTSDTCSSTALNHGALLVGYGSAEVESQYGQMENIDYWLVKNSWSEQWGEDGYFRIVRNQNNKCGLATYASYPIV